MKIRFFDRRPEVKDAIGAFTVHAVGVKSGPDIAELTVALREHREVRKSAFRIFVASASPAALSAEEFESAGAATDAIASGFVVVDESAALSYVQRAIAAKAAEIVI